MPVVEGTPAVSVHVLRSMLDEARAQEHRSGVLGVRSRPQWDGPETFRHGDQQVKVTACPSALAVRQALLDRADADWLVVLTDRADEDLGASLLAHFADFRLRRADPWEAVRSRFAAHTLDPALTADKEHRELAVGLLAAAPAEGWPAAAAGSLTRGHALGAVARARLGLAPDVEIDAVAVLSWTTDPQAVVRVADLRALAGDAVTGAVLTWLAERAGPAAAALLQLFGAGQVADAVPLGLVLGLLHEHTAGSETARTGVKLLESRYTVPLPAEAVRAWSADATGVCLALGEQPGLQRVLGRADELLATADAVGLAARSDLLRAGLTARLELLAESMRTALPAGALALVLDPVEAAWQRVQSHRLAGHDRRVTVFLAAVRLLRWLAQPDPTEPALVDLGARHSQVDAFVDLALDDVYGGVGERELARALANVHDAARARRAGHDRPFAQALAREGCSAPTPLLALEDLLVGVVLPLVAVTPVLLLVLDGMSVAVAAEIVRDVAGSPGSDWVEALLPGATTRTTALAVLPTLARHSRASLLSGQLRSGEQDAERRGYAELLRAAGVTGTLLHKKPLEQGRPGVALAPDVAAALDDLSGNDLVTCVLNTVDDALDRSAPAGTVWDVDAVKHLRPLLERARAVGRLVVLTSDHGHVVERRQGTQRRAPVLSSGRSRPAEPPAQPDEVLVTGERVLDHGGTAVLAVDEGLRYGPLKSGYHGGASPAEALVPVIVLAPGVVPQGAGLREAPVPEPAWWWQAAAAPVDVPPPVALPATPTLFDDPPAAPPIAEQVVASAAYRSARAAAPRVALDDDGVRRLLTSLLAAPAHRLPLPALAVVLHEPAARVRGALSSAQRLLNLEGYPVLSTDLDGSTYVLDVALLREQFELAG